MQFLSANWIWIVLIGAMVWMHLRHGGMHGGHGHRHEDTAHGEHLAAKDAGSPVDGHRHGC